MEISEQIEIYPSGQRITIGQQSKYNNLLFCSSKINFFIGNSLPLSLHLLWLHSIVFEGYKFETLLTWDAAASLTFSQANSFAGPTFSHHRKTFHLNGKKGISIKPLRERFSLQGLTFVIGCWAISTRNRYPLISSCFHFWSIAGF